MNTNMKWALFVALPIMFLVSSNSFAQVGAKPVFAGYKGVMVGMPMADARAKLGTPKDKSDAEDYYVYSDVESVQVLYGTDKTVRVLSINYMGKIAPSPMDVLGVAVDPKADGSVNKQVKYPKAGYWISFLKTGGDDPMTVVTVQKMQPSEQ